MEPNEIFQLILKADEALKYSTPQTAASQTQRARRFLDQARQEAVLLGNTALVEQADRRLADLETLAPNAESGRGG